MTVCVVIFSCLFSAFSAETNQLPSTSQLVKSGAATLHKLSMNKAEWLVNCHMKSGMTIQARVIRDKDNEAWTISSVADGKTTEICRLIQIGGVWYLKEKEQSVKTLPFAARPFFGPLYQVIDLAELRCVNNEVMLNDTMFESRDHNRLFYRIPIPAPERQLLESVIAESKKLEARDPHAFKIPEKAQLQEIGEWLTLGIPLTVEEGTGIVLQTRVEETAVEVEGFHWLDELPAGAFDLPANVKWEDQTKPWRTGDYGDCIMFSHDPLYVLNSDTQLNPSAYILNFRTEEIRRVPFRGISSEPGCFMKDRRLVVVSGRWAIEGTHLMGINLPGGENLVVRRLTMRGVDLTAALSPDGKKIAVLHGFDGGGLTDFQVHLIDLEGQDVQSIGKPVHIGNRFSWLPDGKGLILERIVHAENWNTSGPRMLSRLDLDGQLTDLRAGDAPVVFRKSRRILYRDETHLWRTCKLDGSDPKLFGDGFKDYGDPAISPNERQIIFIRFEKGKLPQMMLFDVGKSKGKPVGPKEGFVRKPVWR